MVVEKIASLKKLDSFQIEKIKRECSRGQTTTSPKNSLLLSVYHDLLKNKKIEPRPELAESLITRRVRSLSGVSVVSVLTKPYPCPGKCLYCPDQKDVPKSYLRNEPAIMRAINNKYDPHDQVVSRLEALEATGHPTDKIELIVIGGTWSCLPEDYQRKFVHECFRAVNGQKSQTLEEAQSINSQGVHRLIGITLETRPDYINPDEVKKMRALGATKVELGVQCLDDKILNINRRGHGVDSVVQATKLLKDAGFKVGYHLMLNLPGADPNQERTAALKMFQDERFRPDFLKIYPTAILAEAPLYKWWQEGRYQPYESEELISLIKDIQRNVPRYCRIQRVVRDIPSESIPVGPVKQTNLREIIQQQMANEGTPCRCIRCREIRDRVQPAELVLFREDYASSQGKEIFLTFEDKKAEILLALLRLRLPSNILSRKDHYWPVLNQSALIREIHTYGRHLSLGERSSSSPQHQGLGKKLMAEAEKILLREFKQVKQIAVIAGVGTRQYYQRLGYKLEETYMVKKI